jgi:multicomponent Na+:H+ antiporter subunit E
MRMITLVTALAAFWLLLSGHYTTWVNSLGALSVLLVSYIVLRMDHTDSRPVSLRLGWRLLKYFAWLFGQVISANIAVARRILQPQMPIEPVWEKVDVKVDSPLQKTLYANSVTLTPDTLTMHIDDEHFLVHALWPESIEGLREGDMQRRVQETGI